MTQIVGDFFGFSAFHQLDADHEAGAPYIADGLIFFLQLLELFGEICAHFLRTLDELLLLYDVESRDGCRKGDGKVSKGEGITGRFGRLEIGALHHTCERKASRNCLAEGEQVGIHTVKLTRKHGSEPAEARLYFIENEQYAFLIAYFANSLEITLRRRDHAARSLHGFEHDGDNRFETPLYHRLHVLGTGYAAFRIFHSHGTAVAIGVWNANHILHVPGKELAQGMIGPARCYGCECSARVVFERREEHHAFGIVGNGELHGRFICHRSVQAEADFLEIPGCQFAQFLQKEQLGNGLKACSHMGDFLNLFCNRFNNSGVAEPYVECPCL